jgi:hypothetical protein
LKKLFISHPPATIATATQTANVILGDTQLEKLGKRKAGSFPGTFTGFIKLLRATRLISKPRAAGHTVSRPQIIGNHLTSRFADLSNFDLTAHLAREPRKRQRTTKPAPGSIPAGRFVSSDPHPQPADGAFPIFQANVAPPRSAILVRPKYVEEARVAW